MPLLFSAGRKNINAMTIRHITIQRVLVYKIEPNEYTSILPIGYGYINRSSGLLITMTSFKNEPLPDDSMYELAMIDSIFPSIESDMVQ